MTEVDTNQLKTVVADKTDASKMSVDVPKQSPPEDSANEQAVKDGNECSPSDSASQGPKDVAKGQSDLRTILLKKRAENSKENESVCMNSKVQKSEEGCAKNAKTTTRSKALQGSNQTVHITEKEDLKSILPDTETKAMETESSSSASKGPGAENDATKDKRAQRKERRIAKLKERRAFRKATKASATQKTAEVPAAVTTGDIPAPMDGESCVGPTASAPQSTEPAASAAMDVELNSENKCASAEKAIAEKDVKDKKNSTAGEKKTPGEIRRRNLAKKAKNGLQSRRSLTAAGKFKSDVRRVVIVAPSLNKGKAKTGAAKGTRDVVKSDAAPEPVQPVAKDVSEKKDDTTGKIKETPKKDATTPAPKSSSAKRMRGRAFRSPAAAAISSISSTPMKTPVSRKRRQDRDESVSPAVSVSPSELGMSCRKRRRMLAAAVLMDEATQTDFVLDVTPASTKTKTEERVNKEAIPAAATAEPTKSLLEQTPCNSVASVEIDGEDEFLDVGSVQMDETPSKDVPAVSSDPAASPAEKASADSAPVDMDDSETPTKVAAEGDVSRSETADVESTSRGAAGGSSANDSTVSSVGCGSEEVLKDDGADETALAPMDSKKRAREDDTDITQSQRKMTDYFSTKRSGSTGGPTKKHKPEPVEFTCRINMKPDLRVLRPPPTVVLVVPRHVVQSKTPNAKSTNRHDRAGKPAVRSPTDASTQSSWAAKPDSVLETLMKIKRQFSKCDLLKDSEWQALQKRIRDAVVGKIVLAKNNDVKYQVLGVDFTQDPSSTFTVKGENVSYAEYYEGKYKLPVHHMDQPLLIVTHYVPHLHQGRPLRRLPVQGVSAPKALPAASAEPHMDVENTPPALSKGSETANQIAHAVSVKPLSATTSAASANGASDMDGVTCSAISAAPAPKAESSTLTNGVAEMDSITCSPAAVAKAEEVKALMPPPPPLTKASAGPITKTSAGPVRRAPAKAAKKPMHLLPELVRFVAA